jgi:hypothetical protein
MLLRRVAILLLLMASTLVAQEKVLYRGHWMRKYDVEKLKYADYMRAHGYVHYFGKWRRKADARKIRAMIHRRARRRTVTLGINFQHAELLGLKTVPVSLGVGTPVRIQLPRMRTVSIGTTVTVPAGR